MTTERRRRVEAIDDVEVDEYRRGIYQLTTITPLVDGPKKNTYILDQSGLDDFLEHSDYAEFIVELKKVLTKVHGGGPLERPARSTNHS